MSVETDISRLKYDVNQLKKTGGNSSVNFYVSGSENSSSVLAGSDFTLSGSNVFFSADTGSNILYLSASTFFDVSGTNPISGSYFVLSGSGVVFNTSGNTIFLTSAAAMDNITLNPSGADALTGSVFNLSGSGVVFNSDLSSNTLFLTFSGPAGGVLGYAGSTYPNPNGLAASVAGGGLVADRIPIKQGNLGVKIKYDTFSEASAGNREFTLEGADAYSFPNPLDGGIISIKGGKGNTQPVVNNGAGGDAEVRGGDGVGNGNGGIGRVIGGYAGNNGAGGATEIFGGSGPGGQNGGNVLIRGGENQFQNATGGSVTIRGGDGVTDGSLNLGLTTTLKVNIGDTTIPTEIYGDLTGSAISASVNVITPTITSSILLTDVVKLSLQDPLPTGQIGMMACSGSKLYFYDGSWREVSLI